jgi:hypothetical protein
MGLTIHWHFQGPKTKTEAKAVVEKLRQRAMDLPFESVGEIVQFKGKDAQFSQNPDEPFRWLKIQARETVWSKDGRMGWDCPAQEIIGFQILVAPGSEPMEVFLATYPKTIMVKDDWGRRKRLRTNRHDWSGGAFCKTQYASSPDCGGVANFLRAHLSVIRMLDHAKELGILAEVSDEGDFWEKRDVKALAEEVGSWNSQIAALVGAMDDAVGEKADAPINSFPDFEHLEAKGQGQIDQFLRLLNKAKMAAPAA